MKKSGILQKLLLGIGFLIVSSSASFAGFGVSPTNVYNEYLKPGAHFEKTITLSRSDPFEDMDIIVEPSLGDIDSWFKYDQGLKFTFPKGETRKTFTIIVDVPEDAAYRNYEGVIRVKAMPRGGSVQGVSIVKGARLDVDLVTTKLSISELNIKSLKMRDSKDGEPLTLEVVAENLGNVEVYPTAKIVIKNLQMEDLEEHIDTEIGFVKPNETSTLFAQFTTTLPEGEYFVDAYVYLGKDVIRKERLVFRITSKVAQVPENNGGAGMLVSSVWGSLKDNSSYILVGLLVGVIVYYLMKELWESKRMKGKENEMWAPLLGVRVVSRIVMSVLIGVLIAVLVWVVSTSDMFVRREKVVEEKTPERKIEITIPLEVSPSKDVKGAKDKAEPDALPTIVGVRDANGKLMYPIYQEMDLNSKISYYAKEGETLKVIEEKPSWYLVQLEDGSSGWLEKTKVKETQTEEK